MKPACEMDEPAAKAVGWQNVGTYKAGGLDCPNLFFTTPDKISESVFGSLPSTEVVTAIASKSLIPILIYDQVNVPLSS